MLVVFVASPRSPSPSAPLPPSHPAVLPPLLSSSLPLRPSPPRCSPLSGAGREVQRTMLELLNQLDGFSSEDRIKVVAATNRIDILDPALLRFPSPATAL